MMHLVISLLLLLAHQSHSQYDAGYLNINCGQDETYLSNYLWWNSDSSFIDPQCGYNNSTNSNNSMSPLFTRRVFPDMNKNCYTLPAFTQQKYLIRAGFNYGNYDSLNRPPSFDLQFDSSKWVTVVTSQDKADFHEMIVVAKKDDISICLARIEGGGTPFISSIEMVNLPPRMYDSVRSDHALFKQYRMSFSSNASVGFPDDMYGRVWDPVPTFVYTNISADFKLLTSLAYTNVSADFKLLTSTVSEDPPVPVIRTAIQSKSANKLIDFSFKLQEYSDRPSYIVLYFAELTKLSSGENRTFDVYFNGEEYGINVSPMYQICNEIHGYIDAVNDSFKVTLQSSKNNSLMPPILNAMEIYTVSEVIANGSSSEDISGLRQLGQSSATLARWSGDPCLPVAWQWLRCNQEDPPRVTELYLSGLGLQFLYDFTDMQELEIIDLHNNDLTGWIPYFLGNLPKLKELNLADNQLVGIVPESLLNRKILLNTSGNPNLRFPDEMYVPSMHIGLIVGLWAGAISIVFGFFIFLFILRRTKGETKVGASDIEINEVETQENNLENPVPN